MESASTDGSHSRAVPSALNIFEIICGPSSSHTVAPVRIARKVFEACGGSPTKVKFTLYNSFAGTGFLHGTYQALLSGILGFKDDDERIWDAMTLAQEKRIEWIFEEVLDLPSVHPNTVRIEYFFTREGERKAGILIGVSLGGGFISFEFQHPEERKGYSHAA